MHKPPLKYLIIKKKMHQLKHLIFTYPMISLIFLRTSCSIRMKTGAISYVNILVFAAAVSHSPAREVTSRPQDSWLKKRGCPETEIVKYK